MKPLARLHLPLVAAACLWAAPAFAGQWTITSTTSGTAEGDYSRSPSPNFTYTYEAAGAANGVIVPPQNETHGSQDLAGLDFYWAQGFRLHANVFATGSGSSTPFSENSFSVQSKTVSHQMKFVFQWERNYDEFWEPDPNDNPPATIKVLMRYDLQGSAEAYYDTWNFGEATASAAVNVGGFSLVVPTASASGANSPVNHFASDHRYDVLTLSVDPLLDRAEAAIQASLTASVQGSSRAGANATGSATAEARIIDHHITSREIEESWYKAVDPAGAIVPRFINTSGVRCRL